MTYYKALRYAEASQVIPIAGGFPLVAFVLAVVMLGESLAMQKVCVAVFVVVGVILLR